MKLGAPVFAVALLLVPLIPSPYYVNVASQILIAAVFASAER